MDLNQLYSSHQIALFSASKAFHPAARAAHFARAAGYGDRIDAFLKTKKASARHIALEGEISA